MTPVLPKSPRPAKARAKATLPSARRKPASPKPQALDSNAIGERIADAISSHRLQPGTKLGEEALGEIFGVSRTKVRQALFQLSAEKLVTLIPGRGAFVAQPSVSEAKGVFEARRVVEAAIVARFIEVATRADIENLAEHVQEEGRAVAAGSAQSRNRLLGDFHTVIAEAAGNAVLAEIVTELVARTSLITLFYQNTRAAHESANEHKALLAAIQKRDVSAAVRLMNEHLSDVENGLVLREDAPQEADLRSALAM